VIAIYALDHNSIRIPRESDEKILKGDLKQIVKKFAITEEERSEKDIDRLRYLIFENKNVKRRKELDGKCVTDQVLVCNHDVKKCFPLCSKEGEAALGPIIIMKAAGVRKGLTVPNEKDCEKVWDLFVKIERVVSSSSISTMDVDTVPSEKKDKKDKKDKKKKDKKDKKEKRDKKKKDKGKKKVLKEEEPSKSKKRERVESKEEEPVVEKKPKLDEKTPKVKEVKEAKLEEMVIDTPSPISTPKKPQPVSNYELNEWYDNLKKSKRGGQL
jgi:flagellar biosynthesis GTPase FlhF